MLYIYSIYDSKAGAFLRPFFEQTDATAVRAVSGVFNDPEHPFSQHGADYTLFCVGEFDEFKGQVKPIEAMSNLGNLLELQKSYPYLNRLSHRPLEAVGASDAGNSAGEDLGGEDVDKRE